MDILLVGGVSVFLNTIINKLNKEGHRIYLLTESRGDKNMNLKVFEKYYFPYDSASLKEIFESIRPDAVLFMGAHDVAFDWSEAKMASVSYSAGLINILICYSAIGKGKFIYLSSEEVYSDSHLSDIEEAEPVSPKGFRAMAIAQGEEQCLNYGRTMGVDAIVLRLDHLYFIPQKREDANSLCARMCLEALQTGRVSANGNNTFSLLYEADAAEFIHKAILSKEHKKNIYHISSSSPTNERKLAQMIQECMGGNVSITDNTIGKEYCIILSNQAFREEFPISIHNREKDVIPRMIAYMKHHRKEFEEQVNDNSELWKKVKVILHVFVPFIENMVCFIPFFMLNNRAVGSRYFTSLDFYLLYVLLFAIIHGQQQATFSAMLAVAGYCFRQMYERSGLEIMLDYNTYVWIAELFILGMIVGYMKDQLNVAREEGQRETEYLKGQLNDIQEINTSNVRVKNVLETQIVNQKDSFGKIYEITSSLDKYEAEEVLFYAAEVLSRLMESRDVAIYTVANRSYARLFSATSSKARKLGNSINYTDLKDMYADLKERKVYINKNLDDRYPVMANAIYAEEEMQLLLMVWGIPWERMTLSQANMLAVIGHLIQNAVIRANRYLEALEQQRYEEGTTILEQGAFSSLLKAYLVARNKGLTECSILAVDVGNGETEAAGRELGKMLRQSDYLGKLKDGRLYALLANTGKEGAEPVIRRFEEAGYKCRFREDVVV